jgi:hypothetical protein
MEITTFLDIVITNDLQYSPDMQILMCALRGTSHTTRQLITQLYTRKSKHIPDAYANLLYYEILYCWNNPDYIMISNFGDLAQIAKFNTNFLICKCNDHAILGYAWIFSKHGLLDKCEALLPRISQKSIYLCYKLSPALREMLNITEVPHRFVSGKWFTYTDDKIINYVIDT